MLGYWLGRYYLPVYHRFRGEIDHHQQWFEVKPETDIMNYIVLWIKNNKELPVLSEKEVIKNKPKQSSQ